MMKIWWQVASGKTLRSDIVGQGVLGRVAYLVKVLRLKQTHPTRVQTPLGAWLGSEVNLVARLTVTFELKIEKR